MRNNNEEINNERNLENQINPKVQNIIVDDANSLDNEVITNEVNEKDLEYKNSKYI